MPRQNKPRSIGREEDLARRIAYEREQHGYSYAGLAARMTKAGCAIDPSALYKIENATPRRRISVDELVALAQVFRVTPDELLVPPEIMADKRAVKLIKEFREARQALADAGARLGAHVADHPRVEQVLKEQLTPDDMRVWVTVGIEEFRKNRMGKKVTTDGEHQQET